MTEGPVHCTNEQLQTLLDGRLAAGEKERVQSHLRQCAPCAAGYTRLERLDAGLRRLPLAEAGAELTGRVMQGVMPPGHLSLAFRIVENLAYLFAALIVTGIMAVVFIVAGVIDSGQVTEGQGLVSTYAGAVSDWLVQAMHGGTVWLERYLPSTAGKNTLVFGIAVLVGLGLLDRLLHRRFVHRAR